MAASRLIAALTITLAATLAAAALAAGAGPVRAEIGAGYDTSLPIEITADSLEVQQEACAKAIGHGRPRPKRMPCTCAEIA